MKPTVFNHSNYTGLVADYMMLKKENDQLKAENDQLKAENEQLKAGLDMAVLDIMCGGQEKVGI